MAKKKNISAVAFLFILIIAALAYWKRDWVKTQLEILKGDDTSSNESSNDNSKGSPYRPKLKISFPLKIGSRGDIVKALQKALNKKFTSGLEVDGIFGRKTKAALVKAGYSYPLRKSIYQMIIN